MFGFLDMLDNYDERKIARFEQGELMIDTCRVTDGEHPYETAVAHPDYNHGDMVIVEAYDTPEDARAGHDRWVAAMTHEPLPEHLVDCCNSWTAELLGQEYLTFERIPKED